MAAQSRGMVARQKAPGGGGVGVPLAVMENTARG